jgi:hypothetical protein
MGEPKVLLVLFGNIKNNSYYIIMFMYQTLKILSFTLLIPAFIVAIPGFILYILSEEYREETIKESIKKYYN